MHYSDHNISVHLSVVLPLWNEHRVINVKIFLRVFLSLTLPGLEEKIEGMTNTGMSNQSLCNIESHSSNLDFCKIQAWGIHFHNNISCHVATLSWLSLPLRHAEQQSCFFITTWVNLYNAFILPLSTLVSVGLEVLYMLLLALKLSMVLRLNNLP
jgi:hypothetical protein